MLDNVCMYEYVYVHTCIYSCRLRVDNDSTSRLISTVKNLFSPFSDCSQLVNIASGALALETVTVDMMNAETIGEAKLCEFVKDRLIDKSVNLFAPLKPIDSRPLIVKLTQKHCQEVNPKLRLQHRTGPCLPGCLWLARIETST